MLGAPFQTAGITHVVGIEARGLSLGTLVAAHLQVPFVPVRKAGGYLPGGRIAVCAQPDWEGKRTTLEIQTHALRPGARVLLIDDWFTTGNQAHAVSELLLNQKAFLAGIAVIAEEFGNTLPPWLRTVSIHALLNWNDDRGQFALSAHFAQSRADLEYQPNVLASTMLQGMTSRARAVLPSLTLSIEDLTLISTARDQAERLRFQVKSEVDEGLKASPDTVAEQEQIKRIFGEGTLQTQLRRYESRLDTVLRLVEQTLEFGANAIPTMTPTALVQYWRDLAFATGLDNAHAMHLASGNWGFTVFDRSAAQLRESVATDLLPTLLTGGIQDARTLVPSALAHLPRARGREGYIRAVVEQNDWAVSPGIVPIVCFEAVRVSKRSADTLKRAGTRIAADFEDVKSELPETAVEALEVYGAFYWLRRQYDLYEYFGLYAFLRHRVIALTFEHLATRSRRAAVGFRRTASLYQYERALRFVVEALQ
jgi:adenine/guanine phosphoribosyltransferase-like PRPP-binding protein